MESEVPFSHEICWFPLGNISNRLPPTSSSCLHLVPDWGSPSPLNSILSSYSPPPSLPFPRELQGHLGSPGHWALGISAISRGIACAQCWAQMQILGFIGRLLLLCHHEVMSDSLQPQGLQHVRLLCPPLLPGICANSCPLSW